MTTENELDPTRPLPVTEADESFREEATAALPTDESPVPPSDSAEPTDRPRVWTAADSLPGHDERPEPPARGVRVGQLIWAGLVCAAGVFLIALALIEKIDIPLLAISLVAVLGLVLVVSAFFVGRTAKPKGPQAT